MAIINVLVKREFYLSQRTDNAQRTLLRLYFADTMHKFLKTSMKPHIYSIENSVNPDKLASLEAS